MDQIGAGGVENIAKRRMPPVTRTVVDGVLTVDQPRLYSLINLHGKSGEHVIELRFQTEGVEASFPFS